jgi:hypothetical protein
MRGKLPSQLGQQKRGARERWASQRFVLSLLVERDSCSFQPMPRTRREVREGLSRKRWTLSLRSLGEITLLFFSEKAKNRDNKKDEREGLRGKR